MKTVNIGNKLISYNISFTKYFIEIVPRQVSLLQTICKYAYYYFFILDICYILFIRKMQTFFEHGKIA